MRGWLAGAVLLGGVPTTAAQDRAPALQLLQNGDFARWEGGAPVGWRVDVGAQQGAGPEAVCAPAGPEGLSLSGDRTTRVWKSVSQQFAVAPDRAYRLTFEARVGGRAHQGEQFKNCWVGFFFADGEGQRLGVEVYDVRAAEWTAGRLVAIPPAGTAAATVTVFLSQTGTLQVRRLSLAPVPPTRADACFDLLAAGIERHYSHFASHGVDWRALAEQHRPAIVAADSPAAFADALVPLLAGLRDLHVTVELAGSPPRATHVARPPHNFDLAHVLARVHVQEREGTHMLVGRTKEGIGYALVGDLPGDADTAERMARLFERLHDRPAIILDLRANVGGDERTGQRVLRSLVDARRVYAQHAYRSGPSPEDFGPAQPRAIAPTEGVARYTGPVVALIGPNTVSSGEAMALMCRVLPTVTLVGLPTRGASGNPKPLALPNGVTVWFSRWVETRPDGAPLEGVGVPPAERVEHPADADGDPTFDRALALLQARLGR
jgi:hypothetical protein